MCMVSAHHSQNVPNIEEKTLVLAEKFTLDLYVLNKQNVNVGKINKASGIYTINGNIWNCNSMCKTKIIN